MGPSTCAASLAAALGIIRFGSALPPLLRGRGESGCETNQKNYQQTKNTRAVYPAPFITPIRTLQTTHPLTSPLALGQVGQTEDCSRCRDGLLRGIGTSCAVTGGARRDQGDLTPHPPRAFL